MWYVLLKNEQLGPMTESEVTELFRQGVLDLQTLVWKDGLDEWSSLNDTPQFAHIVSLDSAAQGPNDDDDDDDDDEEDATLIANPADADLQAALAELLGDDVGDAHRPTEVVTIKGSDSKLAHQPTEALTIDTRGSSPNSDDDSVSSIDDSLDAQDDESEEAQSAADEEPITEAVDVHSILQMATHTLEDLLDDGPAEPPDDRVSTDSAPETQADFADERPTIGFPMPSQFLASTPLKTGAAARADAPVVTEDDDDDGGDDDELSEHGQSGEPVEDDDSVVSLESIDIDSFEADPDYLPKPPRDERDTVAGPTAKSADSPKVTNLISGQSSVPVETENDADVLPPVKTRAETPQSLGPTSPDVQTPNQERAEEKPLPTGAAISAPKTEVQASGEPINGLVNARRKPRKKKWPLIISGIVLLGVCLALVITLGQPAEETDKKRPKTFVIKTIQKTVSPSPDAGQLRAQDAGRDAATREPDAAQTRLDQGPSESPSKAAPIVTAGQEQTSSPAPPAEPSKSKTPPPPSSEKRKAAKKRRPAKDPPLKKSDGVAETKEKTTPQKAKPTIPAASKKVQKNTSGVFQRPTKSRRPVTLNRKQIMKVMKKNQARLKKCVALDPSLKGRLVSVAIQIKRDGKIGRAKVATSIARGTPGGACIEAQVRAYRFPPFRGDQMSITLPLRLQ